MQHLAAVGEATEHAAAAAAAGGGGAFFAARLSKQVSMYVRVCAILGVWLCNLIALLWVCQTWTRCPCWGLARAWEWWDKRFIEVQRHQCTP